MRRLSRAEELLQSLSISDPRDIELEAIAMCCGVDVQEKSLDRCEAQIIGRKDTAIVIVNTQASPERKRFSIGHELGHWEHHRGQSFICRSNDIDDAHPHSPINPEKVADAYAVDLLMPEYMFEKRVRQHGATNFETVSGLKDSFNTSLTATALRLVDFAQQPCILICRTGAGLSWAKKSKDIPSKLFLSNDLDEDTYAYDVLSGKKDATRAHVIPADAWFENDGLVDYEIYEETIRIGRDKILTLLTWRNEEMLERYAA